MNEKYILQAYELYRQDVANTTATPMTYAEFKAKLEASCSCNKKSNLAALFPRRCSFSFHIKKIT